jgi:hypothetical protein
MAEKTKTGVAGGMFNMQDMFNKFMAMDPGENDDEGRSIKNTTMADMFSSAFQSELSKGMSDYQAGISKDMMKAQQQLERQAAGEARREEFTYGMNTMAAEAKFQNDFANAQYSRDIGMLGATGEQERKNIQKQGNENRLTTIVKGEQDRLGIGAQGAQDRKNIAAQGTQDRANITTQQAAQGAREQANIGAQGVQDRANIVTQQKAQADREVGNIQAQGEADKQNILTQQSAQGAREQGNIKTQGDQDRQNIGAQGDQDVRKIGAQGDDNRKTMEKEDELTAKKSNRQSARARSLARAF